MRSVSTKSAGVASEPAESELEAILDISENAYVVYDSAGGVRLASRRLRQLLDLDEGEWGALRDFSSVARVVALRLANPPHQLQPPWVLWQPGNGARCEQLEMADPGRILERLARPLAGESGQTTGWVERYRDYSFDRDLPARGPGGGPTPPTSGLAPAARHAHVRPIPPAPTPINSLLIPHPLPAPA